ncbi:hypothetical protein DICPUDRAFT_92510 [Dictyostelium purpureum]|uniref:Uncharacterized protein n=1 Tax=Dictyostelium purpureum TaxID=5786 RepID=F0ZT20_DICPU|nr:uncharacterized protein DICPUDRAFT_92510 [Dictyostelium purpureum]EGC32910.1 hypothetical protein DICPUDRAFT_92510 [Dictyostelium purpureum]|eukprot:XP_003290558.1 hypothetical protein DICPUDRAFT_92510 [Dictyostelium purpureum]
MGVQFSNIGNRWLIERSIMIEKKKRRSKSLIKILMLGNENSAKHTFAKQVKLIYQNGSFLNSDAKSILPYIKLYISNCFKDVIRVVHAQEKPVYSTDDGELAWNKLKAFSYCPYDFKPNKELAKYIYDLCHDPSFKLVIYPIISSRREDAFYLIENCKRMSSEDYIPTDEDILRCSNTSNQSGIFDTKLEVGKCQYVFVDVGNQRCDRKKWIHQFDDVGVILYFLSLDEFDLPPDEKINCNNKLQENILIYEEIVNNHFYLNTPVIILLNKKEEFTQKLKKVQFNTYFPEYRGSNHPNDVSSFISNKFKQLDHFHINKRLFIHSFNSTNEDQIIDFFSYVKKILEDSI